jgi:hypothetical protein
MLGDKKMSYKYEEKLSCMGIPNWASLLVYQRYNMSRRGTGKLARKNEDMQTMRGVPVFDTEPKKIEFSVLNLILHQIYTY